ncbi:hypothetical protein [Longimicrobium sp.]|uniref:hypothetical protein n=1 Tax=Longimicrobium sp. TaxID=2029185 RepID=UPI002CA80302|nr:hypothetical protein [Longimicrobium sp.]HSU12971.1 hypothetical protein [Longimicrobium sp.]
METRDALWMKLSAAHQEALRVGDSPLRADALADRLPALARDVDASPATDEIKARIRAELADAERVLRRDDDGREAARHLQTALRHAEGSRPRHPNPFGDDD